MVDGGKRRVDDLRRHEVGEDLLHPHVVEPPHRHQIAEPHVRRLVRDRRWRGRAAGSASPTRRAAARTRCRRSRPGAPCRRTGTPARAGNRTCRTGRGCRCSRSSQASAAACRSKIASRLRATFAASVSRWNIRNVAAVARGPLDRELAGGEREQVGRDRLRLGEREPRAAVAGLARGLGAVGDRLPAGRHVERQRPARLQIRLVEARERLRARAPARRCV